MKRKMLIDLLAQYVDDLNHVASRAAVSITTLAEERPELQPLVPVIDRLTETLVPVEPSEEFKNALHAKLVAAWYEKQREASAANREKRRAFFLRAAAIGSFVSAAAVIAVVARSRMQHVHVRAQ